MTERREEREWRCVKLRPDGSVATRYTVVEITSPEGWIAARADWTYSRVEVGPFAFEPGDVLYEYFSLERPYNAFATYRDGSFVGWYCNVTYPTTVTETEIIWHDLWVDVLVEPDGAILVLDEDELQESRIHESDPALHAMIVAARDDLLALVHANAYPFSEVTTTNTAVEERS